MIWTGCLRQLAWPSVGSRWRGSYLGGDIRTPRCPLSFAFFCPSTVLYPDNYQHHIYNFSNFTTSVKSFKMFGFGKCSCRELFRTWRRDDADEW